MLYTLKFRIVIILFKYELSTSWSLSKALLLYSVWSLLRRAFFVCIRQCSSFSFTTKAGLKLLLDCHNS